MLPGWVGWLVACHFTQPLLIYGHHDKYAPAMGVAHSSCGQAGPEEVTSLLRPAFSIILFALSRQIDKLNLTAYNLLHIHISFYPSDDIL